MSDQVLAVFVLGCFNLAALIVNGIFTYLQGKKLEVVHKATNSLVKGLVEGAGREGELRGRAKQKRESP